MIITKEAYEQHILPRLKEEDGCLIWTGPINGFGYGIGYYGKPVHIRYWEYHNGYTPKGKELVHNCPRKLKTCVRHVRPLTHQENAAEGRAGENWTAKTHCPQGHEYTKENTYIGPNGGRNCKQCNRDRHRRHPTSIKDRAR